MKNRIAFVVGHSHWGKSYTLRALTNDNYRQRRISIKQYEFYIRRMSNDDRPDYDPESYFNFMSSLNPNKTPYLIASFCPNFDRSETEKLLRALTTKGYELYFWVMERQFNGLGIVTKAEIERMTKLGTVAILPSAKEAPTRARLFKQFVSNVVLA